jgi:hypothetical protein
MVVFVDRIRGLRGVCCASTASTPQNPTAHIKIRLLDIIVQAKFSDF